MGVEETWNRATATARTIYHLIAWGGVASVLIYGLSLWKPGFWGGADPLEALEAEEAGRVREILNYCGRGTADSRTCLLWIASYKELLTGEAQQVALFDKESSARIAEMKRHRGLEAEAEAATVPGKRKGEGL